MKRLALVAGLVAAPWLILIGLTILLGGADILPFIAGIFGFVCAVLALLGVLFSRDDDGTYRRDVLTEEKLDQARDRLRDPNVFVLPPDDGFRDAR